MYLVGLGTDTERWCVFNLASCNRRRSTRRGWSNLAGGTALGTATYRASMDSTDSTCVFCHIVRGDTATDTANDIGAHIVWRDESTVAFLDRSPLFRGHTLVVPTRHVVQLSELKADLVGPFFRRVQAVATAMPIALDAQGTFVAMNNVVSQSVAHLHAHVVPRRKGDGLRGFFWPRERYGEGEAAYFADRLRGVLATLDVEDGRSDP
jgi:histidine triad (HIT) family protein